MFIDPNFTVVSIFLHVWYPGAEYHHGWRMTVHYLRDARTKMSSRQSPQLRAVSAQSSRHHHALSSWLTTNAQHSAVLIWSSRHLVHPDHGQGKANPFLQRPNGAILESRILFWHPWRIWLVFCLTKMCLVRRLTPWRRCWGSSRGRMFRRRRRRWRGCSTPTAASPSTSSPSSSSPS